MSRIKRTLIKQLEKNGMEPDTIPGFMRSLAKTLSINPHMELLQVNERLNYLGWEEAELDYHTLQLAIAYFETNDIEAV